MGSAASSTQQHSNRSLLRSTYRQPLEMSERRPASIASQRGAIVEAPVVARKQEELSYRRAAASSGTVVPPRGMSPDESRADENSASPSDLSNDLLLMRITVILTMLCAILVGIMFGSSLDGRAVLAMVVLLIVCSIGLRGAFRIDLRMLRWFMWGLTGWVIICVISVILYVGIGQGTNSVEYTAFAHNRCDVDFFVTMFGTNCSSQADAVNSCYNECVRKVLHSVDMNTGFATATLAIASAFVVRQCYRLLKRLRRLEKSREGPAVQNARLHGDEVVAQPLQTPEIDAPQSPIVHM